MELRASERKHDLRFELVLVFVFLRLHPVFVSDVIAVYFFDVVILLLILSTGVLRISNVEIIVSLILFAVLAMKWCSMRFDSDSFLSVIKIVYYMVFYRFINDKIKKPLKMKQFQKICNSCFWIMFCIAIIQFLQIPGLSTVIYALYGEQKLRSLWSGNPRVYSTFFNANWFAVFIAGFAVYEISEYFINKKSGMFMLRMLACSVLVIISGSRTGLIAFVIGAAVCIVFHKNGKLIIESIAGIILAVMAVFYFGSKSEFFATTFKRYIYLKQILTTFGHGNHIESLSDSRWLFWKEGWQKFVESPIVGNGMGNLIPHNAYLSFLISFGLLGTMTIVPFVLYFIKKYTNKKNGRRIRAFSLALFAMYGVVMMSGDYLYSTQTMLAMITLLCLGAGFKESTCIIPLKQYIRLYDRGMDR